MMTKDLTATDARRLQAEGVSQDERLRQAIDRCNAAILDVARNRGEGLIEVLVFYLTMESLHKLVDDLESRGFQLCAAYVDQKKSKIVIKWEATDGSRQEDHASGSDA